MSPEVVRLERIPSTGTLSVFESHREGEAIGTIVVPTRDHVNAATVTSLINTDFRWLPQGKTVEHAIVQGSILTLQRNEAIERMRGDWLLFIDDDMVWRPDAVGRLIEAREENDLDILGGLCFRRSEPHQPTLFMREGQDGGSYNYLERWAQGEVVEVDATGMAFVIIHKRVFEMIAGGPMPPYEQRQAAGGPPPNFFKWEGAYGEDLRFCQDAKAAGARIWVDTSIEIGHIGERTIDHRTFLEGVAQRDPATLVARRDLNGKMGLPTMEPAEAKERLGW